MDGNNRVRIALMSHGCLKHESLSYPYLAWISYLQAEYVLAEEYARLAYGDLQLLQSSSGQAAIASMLGLITQATGDYATAREWYETALELTPESDAESYAACLNNLGGLLKAQGDLAAARPYYERALAIHEQVLGPDHPNTGISAGNLAGILEAFGDLAAARPLRERALTIHEKAFGPQHPDTASSLNNLGALLKAQGELAAARPLYERALAIWEQVLGPQHPDTAGSLNNLGALLQDQGELAAARPYYVGLVSALTFRPARVMPPPHAPTDRPRHPAQTCRVGGAASA
jgi:tetratricopeptide (TPR) repeat protein